MNQNASSRDATPCACWGNVKVFIEGNADLQLQAEVTQHLTTCKYCAIEMELIEARFARKIRQIQDLIAAASNHDFELNSVPIEVNESIRRIGKLPPGANIDG